MARFWNTSDFLKTAAIQWGIDNEDNAIRDLENQLGGEITRCGLFISKSHQFIGASPDGIYQDSLIEVKCPFILRDAEPTDFSNLNRQQRGSFCSSLTAAGTLKLKKNHLCNLDA